MIFNQISEKEWDSFVEKTEYTIFHTSKWLRTLDERTEFWVLKNSNNVELAGIAFLRKRRYGLKIITHPVLSPYGGILINKKIFVDSSKTKAHSNVKKIILEVLNNLKAKANVIVMELPKNYNDFHPFIWEGFDIKVHHSYILKKDKEDVLWKNMDSKRRNDIKRAIRDGISISVDSDKETLKKMVLKTFSRQNMQYSISNIDKVFEATDNVKTFTAYKGDLPVAAACIVWDKKSAYYILGGYDPDNRHSGAQALALWKAILFTFNELNLEFFDFEGSTVPNIERFFRDFGGDLVTVHRAIFFSSKFLKFLSEFKK